MVDFQKKIQFLYHIVYKENINELTKAFIPLDKPTNKDLRSRKVTINKWMKNTLKKEPNKFHNDYFKYPISQITFNNKEEVFPLLAFTEWSLNEFEKRYFDFQEENEKINITKNSSLYDYKYIYYYHEELNDIAYFEIDYKEDSIVNIVTNFHSQVLIYTGKIADNKDNDMLNFILYGEYEMIFFSFNKLEINLKSEVYGISLSKDFSLRNPKASKVLLTKNTLTKEYRKLHSIKINSSNILIANNINSEHSGEKIFIDNFSSHLRALKKSIDTYETDTIFLSLFLEEFQLFYDKFYNFYNKHEFQFTSLSKSIKHILNQLTKTRVKHHIQILYTLKDVNNSLFSNMDESNIKLYNKLIKIALKQQISFEFIIVLKKRVKMSEDLKKKFKRFEKSGITLRFRDYKEVFLYSNLILISDYPLAISCLKGQQMYKVTNFNPEINFLKNEYQIQRNHSVFLYTLLEKKYTLNGKYYMYSYGSNNELYKEELFIDGNIITGNIISHYNIKYHGQVYRLYGDILLCTEYGFIKFKEEDENKTIKIVSLIGDQHNGNRKPLVLFAILSRVPIEDKDLNKLFSSMVDIKNSPYEKASFKLSLSIYEVLKPLLFKYEEIERKLKYKNLSKKGS